MQMSLSGLVDPPEYIMWMKKHFDKVVLLQYLLQRAIAQEEVSNVSMQSDAADEFQLMTCFQEQHPGVNPTSVATLRRRAKYVRGSRQQLGQVSKQRE
jgi:hypothetical protein